MSADDRDRPVRWLGVDLGDKRTGLAVGDVASGLASPAGVIERLGPDDLAAAVARAATEHDAGGVVVGLPLNMDGSEGPRAKLARAFGGRLTARGVAVVELFDERLTSADADWAMAGSGLTHKQKKARRDALAAAALLRDFLAHERRADRPDAEQSTDQEVSQE